MTSNTKESQNSVNITNRSQIIRDSIIGMGKHVKAHDMVFSSLNLSPKMCDVLALLFTKMRAEDWFDDYDVDKGVEANPRYEFTTTEMKEFFRQPHSRHLSSLLRTPAKKLNETVVGIENSNGDFDFAPLFSRIRYENRILTIVPNPELRHSYIAKAKANGYALINNKMYLALTDAYSKKTLDLLSRFKCGQSLYPISIKKLQYLYGVYGSDGTLSKPTYKSAATFIRRVIEPSLKSIANSPESQGHIQIEMGASGNLGYEVEGSGETAKVTFLYHWLDSFSQDDIEQAKTLIEGLLMRNLTLQKQGESLTFDELSEIKTACGVILADSDEPESAYKAILKEVEIAMIKQETVMRKDDITQDTRNDKIQSLVEKGLVTF